MIIWLNGPFGGGKTTTANELVGLLPGAHFFDPEMVGYFLRHVLPDAQGDFQDLPAWRALAAETALQVHAHYGGPLVVAMTVLCKDYHDEIFTAIRARGVGVRHVVLDVEHDEHVRRIESDEIEAGAKEWRLRHIPRYREALSWLRDAGEVVDTTHEPAAAIAARLAKGLIPTISTS
ncbi:ATP-binding protein [Nonomuraea dietziae]|uniref:ATP-binding protein n=1 Tax=Nonomuraea dietziae TaxID=65515 RepID=UPI00340474E3